LERTIVSPIVAAGCDRNRTFDRFDYVGQADRSRGPGELQATVGAARRAKQMRAGKQLSLIHI
jgi:hypothetical protein